MNDAGIEATVSGRAKHLWSIHQKMKKTGRDLEQIHDVIAFRLVVGSVRDCYGGAGGGALALDAGARAASRTSSPCPSPTSTSRCTPR